MNTLKNIQATCVMPDEVWGRHGQVETLGVMIGNRTRDFLMNIPRSKKACDTLWRMAVKKYRKMNNSELSLDDLDGLQSALYLLLEEDKWKDFLGQKGERFVGGEFKQCTLVRLFQEAIDQRKNFRAWAGGCVKKNEYGELTRLAPEMTFVQIRDLEHALYESDKRLDECLQLIEWMSDETEDEKRKQAWANVIESRLFQYEQDLTYSRDQVRSSDIEVTFLVCARILRQTSGKSLEFRVRSVCKNYFRYLESVRHTRSLSLFEATSYRELSNMSRDDFSLQGSSLRSKLLTMGKAQAS